MKAAFRVVGFSTELKIVEGTRSQHFSVVNGQKQAESNRVLLQANSITKQSKYIDHLQHPP